MTRMIDRTPTPVAGRVRRTQSEVVAKQLAALEMFTNARAAARLAERATGRTREARMDAERRLEVLRRQHEAVVAQTDLQLKTSATPLLRSTVEPRILIAHRSEWFAAKFGIEVADRGVGLAAVVDNGADAVGIALSEQPELVLVEDRLAMIPGEEVVREVRRYCPDAVIAAHVHSSDRVGPLLEAGAHCVYTRQVPPGDVAAGLLELAGI